MLRYRASLPAVNSSALFVSILKSSGTVNPTPWVSQIISVWAWRPNARKRSNKGVSNERFVCFILVFDVSESDDMKFQM